MARTLQRFVWRFVRRLLATQGYALIKLPRMSRTLEDASRTLAETHNDIQTIADIGIYQGEPVGTLDCPIPIVRL